MKIPTILKRALKSLQIRWGRVRGCKIPGCEHPKPKAYVVMGGHQPPTISVEFEREASMRATEIVIINKGRKGEYGVRLLAHDTGVIKWYNPPHALIDGIDIL